MKKSINIFLVICSMAIVVNTASAQTLTAKTLIFAKQAGTLSISNGKASVALTKDVTDELNDKEDSPSYYVIFTPVASDNINVTITEKNDQSFAVKAHSKKINTAGVKIDYVVFVKKTVSMPDPLAISQLKHKGVSPK